MKQRRAKDQLRDLGVRPSKVRGQNFLVSEDALDRIIEFIAPQQGQRLVEIGPGLGALTKRLLPFGPVTCIEIEAVFCQELKQQFQGTPEGDRLTILHDDFCRFDVPKLVEPGGERVTLVGNLPYSRSTDIITHVLDNSKSVKRGVFLLQREFAERVAAPPGGRDYGTLSIGVQLQAGVRLGPIIDGSLFHPPTAVTSRVLELTFSETPPYEVDDPAWVRRIVKAAFSQRRRTVQNSLRGSGFFPGDLVERSLAGAGIEPRRRAETISVGEFLLLAKLLRDEPTTP